MRLAGRQAAAAECEGRGLWARSLPGRLLPAHQHRVCERMQRRWARGIAPTLTHPADARVAAPPPHAHLPGPRRTLHTGATVQCRDSTPEHCTEERFASTQCSTVVDPATGEPVRHCVKLYRRYLKCAGRCATLPCRRPPSFLLPVGHGMCCVHLRAQAAAPARAAHAAPPLLHCHPFPHPPPSQPSPPCSASQA